MTVFENYLDRAIDQLKAGSGDLFSKSVHDLEDHTGIPGVGGGGGGLTAGKYSLFSQASTVTAASSGLQFAIMAQLLNTTAGDVTFDPLVDTAVINIVTSGFYGVGIFGQWNIDASIPETGQRQILAQVGGAGLDNETAVMFNNLRLADTVGGATAADDAHLLQNAFRFGYIHAGSKFTAKYANGDALNTSTLAGFGISIARLA